MNSVEEDDSDYEDVSCIDFTSCPVCMDRYSLSEGQKTPIILQCHHSLCKACCLLLVDQARVQANHYGYPYLHRSTNSQIISCPVCRKQLQIREGEYPVNFYITKFLEEMKKKRDLGPNLALWCKDCKSVAKEVCRLHSTVKLGDALCNLATNHKYISSTLMEILSTHIDSSNKAASDNDVSVRKLETSMSELRSFISKMKYFLRALGNKKQEIYETFSSCRDSICKSMEKAKSCEPFACNSDDLIQNSQTWLQSSKKVDDETLRGRARVVCQSTQIKLVRTLEENILKLQEQELAISSGKKLQDNFNKEQGQINTDFFKFECKRLIDKFKRAFDACFSEINKLKDLYDIPNDFSVPFGRSKEDKPKLLAKELNPSLKFFIELIQAEKGTGSGAASASNVPTPSPKVSKIEDKTEQVSDSIQLVTSTPAESDNAINTIEDVNNIHSPVVVEYNYDFPLPAADNNDIDVDDTVTTINEINRMTANFFEESQLERSEMFSNFCPLSTDQNHVLFPKIGDNTVARMELGTSLNLDCSYIDDRTKYRPWSDLRMCYKEKRLNEDKDHDHVKRLRSSSANAAKKDHKRRIVKNRKSPLAAEILNICSDTE